MYKEDLELKLIGHSICGNIIETAMIFEGLINGIIAHYFCKRDYKLDQFIGLIQEVSINKRIDFIDIIIDDLDKSVKISKNIDFEYLYKPNKNKEGNIERLKVKDIISALEVYFTLRNHFAHGFIKCLDIKRNENIITYYNFQLIDFRPFNGSGVLKKGEDMLTNRIESFDKEDYFSLGRDIIRIKKFLKNLDNNFL